MYRSPKHKYFRSDWSKYNFKYSYQDKLFLNKKFCDYGYLYIDEMINAIFKLGYTELLPEVIMSLNASFKKIFKHYSKNPKKIISTIRNNKERILTILYKAYIEYSDDIKQDEDLIKSFESILEIFVNQDYEEFAVILDEFRTH